MQDSRHRADCHSNYSLNFKQEIRNVLPGAFVKNSGIRLDWNGCRSYTQSGSSHGLFRKEVIQPQVLLRLPCYDFTPIMSHTLGRCPLAVGVRTSSTTHFRDVTGGVYKARGRIHGGVLIHHY